MRTVTLTGSTGSTYKFEIYSINKLGSFDDLEEVEAVYMFARVTTDARMQRRKFRAVYIGETEDVKGRLDTGHHRIADIKKKKRPTSSSIGTKKTCCCS